MINWNNASPPLNLLIDNPNTKPLVNTLGSLPSRVSLIIKLSLKELDPKLRQPCLLLQSFF